MLKKIFLSICLIAVIAYLSLWAWAVHWIDEDKNIVDFVSDEKNITLETAKLIWQITPAINREKDAQRLLKMAEWSAYTDLTHNITMLKNNYNTISQYHKKHENKLNEPLKSKFILQKLIFMNRSLNDIKDDEFEKEIANMIANYSFYGKDNLETRIEWLPEFLWFIFWHQNTIYYDADIHRKMVQQYTNYFNNDIGSIIGKYNYFAAYTYGSLQCYNYHVYNNYQDKQLLSKVDNVGKTIFQRLNKYITINKKELDDFNELINKNSNYLTIFAIIFFDKQSECRKEAMNFLSKMNEVSTVLGKETVISKSLKSNLF
ncbi:MAG: hypothetical protein IKG79_09450 [Neisseriaceae bacterium]|nr:hypothetical protein [Neisseriaceae bacterium]